MLPFRNMLPSRSILLPFRNILRADLPHTGIGALALAAVLCAQLAAPAVADEIRWGAVGHDDKPNLGPGYSYNRQSLDRQMQLLTAAGLHWYRTGCVDKGCADLLAAAQKAGVSILRGIALWPDGHTDESGNYKRAYKYGSDLAREYPQFQYFEASNEVDNWVGMKGDGSSRSQYNQDRYPQARGLIKGLIDGVHAGNPSAKVLVDDAGYCHYGFLKALWEDGIRWDITAFHWYADQGNIEKARCNAANVAAIHASFGPPVWITEFNSNIAARDNDDTEAQQWLSEFVAQMFGVARKYKIEGVFVYELLDEPNLPGEQGHYGIADGNGNPKKPHKAISDSLASRGAKQ